MQDTGINWNVRWATATSCGDRENNEDAIKTAAFDTRFCFALADGLGGHGSGEEASRIAVNTACDGLKNAPFAKESLDLCFLEAHKKILDRQRIIGNRNALKTTLVLLCVEGGRALYGHIGDSRLYCFPRGRTYCRTVDHSVPQMLVNTRKIRERDIRFHEDRNRLLRVLGMECEELRHEMSEPVALRGGDAFLLCSDGWWEWITETRMIRLLRKARDPAQWLAEMEREILFAGRGRGMDNYSAVAVMIGEA